MIGLCAESRELREQLNKNTNPRAEMNRHIKLLEREEIASEDDSLQVSDEQIRRMLEGSDDPVVNAVRKLGYIPPSVKKQKDEQADKAGELMEKRKRAKMPLPGTLRALGRSPFTPESVAAYKKAALRKPLQLTNTSMLSIFRNSETRSLAVVVSLVIGIIVYWLAGIALTQVLSLGFSLGSLGWLPVLALVAGLMIDSVFGQERAGGILDVLAAIFGGPILWFDAVCGPSEKVWQAVPIADYQKDIPRPVLETIANIMPKCPGARFEVEEIAKKPDPFLVVSLGDERYYVEIWDEPNWNGTRAVS